MKNMKSVKILLAVIFLIPLIFWGVLFSQHEKKLNLINTGIHTQAYVDGYILTNSDDDDEGTIDKYRYTYYYEVDGVNHTGKSDATYRRYQVQEFYHEYVEIVYDPVTFESIEANYNTHTPVVLYILPLFALVSIGLVISLICDIINNSKSKQIKKKGKLTKATFKNSKHVFSINNIPHYRVAYEYQDDKGVTYTGKTRATLTGYQLGYLETLHTFNIRYIGKKSVIVEDISDEKINKPFSNEKKETKPTENIEKTKKCVFCGSILEEKIKRCPNCGSTQFKDKN